MDVLFRDITGADRGFHVSADVLTQTADGVNLNTLWDEFQAALSLSNENRNLIARLFTYDTTRACGERITAITLNGVPLDPAASYKVTMNNFLADGGDSFPGMTAGTDRVTAPAFDVDALAAYLGAGAPVAPGPQNRIVKAG